MSITEKQFNKFKELAEKSIDEQCEFFLKSFIFALGDDWPAVVKLSKSFKKYLEDAGNKTSYQMDEAQAADFLQKNGRTRTATQRREEIKDIDLDNNKHISFIEYLLLHYKHMILEEYFKRTNEDSKESLKDFAIGVTGVGNKLLDELFTMPVGMSEELEQAIENFYAEKRQREQKVKELTDAASGEGVKALRAKNELSQMEAQDQTEMNRMEIQLNHAKKKATKNSAEMVLNEKKKKQEEEEKKKLEEGRAKIKNVASLWENK
ncbi:hypothetical protein ABK040_006694 [Willaertia magna]